MRILVTSILDLKRVGHNRLHSLLKHLAKNHQVTALCLNAWWLDSHDSRETDYYHDPYFDILKRKVQIKYLYEKKAPPLLQELLSIMRIGKLWRFLSGHHFDIHVNYCNLLVGYFVTLRAHRAHIPTVFDVADDLPDAMRISAQIPRILRSPAGRLAQHLQRRNARLVDRITVSCEILSQLPDFPPHKVTIVPNGVDTKLFRKRPASLLRKQLGLDGCFVIGFVGTLWEWVDLSPVFGAMGALCERYPNVRLLIVGGGEKLEEVKRMAFDHGVNRATVFTGSVPYSQVPHYISAMDVGTIPFHPLAISEGALPLKLLEYMACSRPVISTPLEGVIRAVGARVSYAANQEEWERGIARLYEDDEARNRMGTVGSEYIEKNYSWSKVCEQFEAVLLEIGSRST